MVALSVFVARELPGRMPPARADPAGLSGSVEILRGVSHPHPGSPAWATWSLEPWDIRLGGPET